VGKKIVCTNSGARNKAAVGGAGQSQIASSERVQRFAAFHDGQQPEETPAPLDPQVDGGDGGLGQDESGYSFNPDLIE
jgi:hypothetical protein